MSGTHRRGIAAHFTLPEIVGGIENKFIFRSNHQEQASLRTIMSTLSGGGAHRVSSCARTLLGANAGVGISLGYHCIVEAGLYVTAGSKIVLADEPRRADGALPTVKGAELSGRDGVLFPWS